MTKTDLLCVAAIALLSLCGVTTGATSHDPSGQEESSGNLLRLPFHESFDCLDASSFPEHWLTSDADLDAEIAKELGDYLQESFVPYRYIRSEGLNITLKGSVHANKDDSSRSFLRQKDYKANSCDFVLELAGEAIFAIDSQNETPASTAFEANRFPLLTQRSVIYSRVAKSLGTSLTATPHSEEVSAKPRRLQTCVSHVQSLYSFTSNEFLCSSNGGFFFGFGDDGDLAIWKESRKVWSAGTIGKGSMARLQPDGNLVVRDEIDAVLWTSQTNGAVDSGGEVQITDNGEVSVINSRAGKTKTIVPSLENLEECANKLEAIARLMPGERICSQDGKFAFGLTSAGILGIFFGPKQVWSAGLGDGAFGHLQADGNFVLRSVSGGVLWESGTGGLEGANAMVTIGTDGTVTIVNQSAGKTVTIEPFDDDPVAYEEDEHGNDPVNPVDDTCIEQVAGRIHLQARDFICSPNGRYRFGVTLNGDLQLLDGSSTVWSAGTCCSDDGVYMHMQGDGNLVVRDNAGDALWTSKTSENTGSSLRLDDNGVAKILSPGGTLLWSATGSEPPSPTQTPPTPSPPPPPTLNKSPPLDPSLLPCLDPVQGRVIMSQGDFFCSPNGIFKFGMALDGDLALFEGSRKIWSANTCCTGEELRARLQVDANLVVETLTNEVIWASNSANPNTDVASLIVGDDGSVIINDTNLGSLWSTEIGGTPTTPTPVQTPPSPPPTPLLTPPTLIPRAPPLDPSLITCRDPVRGPVLFNEGDFFCSPSGEYKFGLTLDGDLALFEGSRKIWNTDTCCTGEGVIARLQSDGNLVVSTLVSEQVIWTSQSVTQDLKVASLIVGDDGIVTITDTIRGHIWSSAITNAGDRVETDSLVGKVMAGYQGWFFAKGDAGMNQWIHWSRPETVPSKNSITIDAWPDLRELDDDELYPTEFTYKDGSNAGLYSAYNAKTVERHAKWMKDYGLHGVFAQRFIGNARASNWTPVIDKVLANVRSGAEKHGRTFVNMYDIGNGNEATIVQDIINDWKHLVDDEHITKSKQYLYHRGRPLVAIWGFGFYDRLGSPQQVAEIIDWFQNKAEDKYKATLMGGVPTGWRDLSRDSKSAAAWASIYRSYDVISPWAVGRLADIRTANYHRTRYTEPDLAECASLGIDYLPVVFPGFSFNNLKPKKPFNEIPRSGGTFMWHQMYNAVAAGSKMIYVAMFDEVDEATAIFKIADNQQQTPREGRFLSADFEAGYEKCPGDWYLNITGIVAGLVQDGKEVPANMPAYP